jgi:hypothetical protein
VHAVVDAGDVAKGCQKAASLSVVPRAAKRVEDPNLDVFVCRQSQKQRILATGVQVVNQQTNPNAALGRIA